MIYSICATLLLIGVLGLLAQTLLDGAHIGHSHARHAHIGHSRGPSVLWKLLSPLLATQLAAQLVSGQPRLDNPAELSNAKSNGIEPTAADTAALAVKRR